MESECSFAWPENPSFSFFLSYFFFLSFFLSFFPFFLSRDRRCTSCKPRFSWGATTRLQHCRRRCLARSKDRARPSMLAPLCVPIPCSCSRRSATRRRPRPRPMIPWPPSSAFSQNRPSAGLVGGMAGKTRTKADLLFCFGLLLFFLLLLLSLSCVVRRSKNFGAPARRLNGHRRSWSCSGRTRRR